MSLSPSLYSLIATYWQRYDDLCIAMRHTDACESDTPEREAAYAAQFEAGGRLDEALLNACAFVPCTRVDAKIRAQFLSLVIEMDGGTANEIVLKAILKSLPELVHYSAQAERASV